MALPPIKGQGIGSLIVPQEQLDENYCWATNRPQIGANIARELAASQNGEDSTVNKLESYTPSVRGSREKPSIMRYPYDIGSPKSEIPHIMQFKVYWRWENPDFAETAIKLKKEAEENLEQLVSATNLIEDGNYNIENLSKQFGMVPQQDINNAYKMLYDPSFVDPKNPSNDRTLYDLLNNPETREEGRRIMERNVRSATNRVENISSEFITSIDPLTGITGTKLGAIDITQDKTVLEGRFNRLVADVEKADPTGISSYLSSNGLRQRDPQYDQMVSVYLPICTRINNEDTFTYSDTDMKLASGIIASIGGLAKGYGSDLKQPLVEIAKQSALALTTAAASSSPFGSGAIPSITGLVINPRIEKIFQQKDIRNFTFSWELYPRNEEEVKTVQNIIETFRYHSHPARSRDLNDNSGTPDPQIMLRVPAEFTIKFLSSARGSAGEGFVENEYIPKISRCVLNSISVDYTPNGVFSTLEDNSPTGYVLTLSFSEIAQLTREDIKDGF